MTQNPTDTKTKPIKNLYRNSYWLLEKLFMLVCLAIMAWVGYGLGYVLYHINTTPDIKKMDTYETYSIPTELYDIDGVKFKEFHTRRRQIIPLVQVSPNINTSLIVYEDERFLDHQGIDLYGLLRALYINISNMAIKEGGSTLTQQLVKWSFIDEDLQQSRTLERKLLEYWYILQVEKRYSKQEILERYINTIELPRGTDGFEAACQFYFNKSALEVDWSEAAALVSTLSLPLETDPLKNWSRVRNKTQIIFDKVVEHDFADPKRIDSINLDEFNQQLYVRFTNRRSEVVQEENLDLAPYFSEYVFRQLKELFKQDEFKNLPPIHGGGYKIYTTLHLAQQQKAQYLLNEQLAKQDQIHLDKQGYMYRYAKEHCSDIFDLIGLGFGQSQFNFVDRSVKREALWEEFIPNLNMFALLGNHFAVESLAEMFGKRSYHFPDHPKILDYPCQGSLIALNPKNGHIEVLIGGRGFEKGKSELIRAIDSRRQPGSCFKPFVYTAALNNLRFTPGSVILDEDSRLRVRNYNRQFSGPVTLRHALKSSINVVAAKLVKYLHYDRESAYFRYLRGLYSTSDRDFDDIREDIALEGMPRNSNVYQVAARMMGIPESRFPENLDISVGLGSRSVTPMEITRGMAVLANRGAEVKPISILRIYDRNGRLIKNFEADDPAQHKERILDERVTYLVTDMMESVTSEPGGTARGAMNRGGIDFRVAGKTGTTSQYKDAWFVGYTPDLVCTVWVGFDWNQSLGSHQVGGNVAAPVWAKFMKQRIHTNNWFQQPRGIIRRTICTHTGLLAGSHCPHDKELELFIAGTEPDTYCSGVSNLHPSQEVTDTIGELLTMFDAKANEDEKGTSGDILGDLLNLNKKEDPENPKVDGKPDTKVDGKPDKIDPQSKIPDHTEGSPGDTTHPNPDTQSPNHPPTPDPDSTQDPIISPTRDPDEDPDKPSTTPEEPNTHSESTSENNSNGSNSDDASNDSHDTTTQTTRTNSNSIDDALELVPK